MEPPCYSSQPTAGKEHQQIRTQVTKGQTSVFRQGEVEEAGVPLIHTQISFFFNSNERCQH